MLYDEEATSGGMPSMTVTGRSGAAAISLPVGSATAPSSTSSCGVAIALTSSSCGPERVRVMIPMDEKSKDSGAMPSRERPPEEWPISRICRRS